MAVNYKVIFKLTSFVGARIEEEENADGLKEIGVFIPLEPNGLKLSTSNRVFATAFAKDVSYTGRAYTHLITQCIPKEQLEKLRELGYNAPNIGYIKYATKNSHTSYANHNMNKRVKKL